MGFFETEQGKNGIVTSIPMSDDLADKFTNKPLFGEGKVPTAVPTDGPTLSAKDEFELVTSFTLINRLRAPFSTINIDNTTGFMGSNPNDYLIETMMQYGDERVHYFMENAGKQSTGKLGKSVFDSDPYAGVPFSEDNYGGKPINGAFAKGGKPMFLPEQDIRGIFAFFIQTVSYGNEELARKSDCEYCQAGLDARAQSTSDTETTLRFAKWMAKNVRFAAAGFADGIAKKMPETIGKFANPFSKMGNNMHEAWATAATVGLRAAGVAARYVRTDDGAWTAVKLDGNWTLLDFSKVQNLRTVSELSIDMLVTDDIDRKMFMSGIGGFDECERAILYHNLLRKSVYEVGIGDYAIRVNGAGGELSDSSTIVIYDKTSVLVDICRMIDCAGGYYNRSNNGITAYIGTQKYEIPASALIDMNKRAYVNATDLSMLDFKISVSTDNKLVMQYQL